jgi:hypothetical protein
MALSRRRRQRGVPAEITGSMKCPSRGVNLQCGSLQNSNRRGSSKSPLHLLGDAPEIARLRRVARITSVAVELRRAARGVRCGERGSKEARRGSFIQR